MLKRFLAFLVVGALLAGFGVLFYLNPGSVDFRLPQGRSYSLPLPLLLLLSFFVGALLIFMLALVRETQWTLSTRRQRRLARRAERRRGALAASRDLLWHDRPGEARNLLRRTAAGDVEPALLFAETALAESGSLAEARGVLEEALGRHPEQPQLLALLAEVLERSGERTAAIHVLDRALARAPQSRRLATHLRDLCVSEERWREALRTQQLLLGLVRSPGEIAREELVARGIRCEAAMALADPEAALAELRQAHLELPGFAPAAVALGDRLRAAGRLREGVRVWVRAARRRPLPALLGRIEAGYRELGRPKKALSLYRRLCRSFDSPWLALQPARFLLVEGDLVEAERILQALRARLGDSAEFCALAGEIHRLRGQSELAAQSFRSALDPLNGDRRSYLCHVCTRSFPAWSARCPGCGAWDALEV